MEGSETPTPPSTPPATGGTPPDPHERIDGLRRWINELDEKLKKRTFAGAAALLAALGLGGAGLGVALTQEDEGPTQAQIGRLQAQIAQLQSESTTAGGEVEENLDAVAKAVDRLIKQIEDFQGDRKQFNEDLSEIRQDLRQLMQEQGSGGGGNP
jgi:uncharacterized protein HemX